MPCWTTTEISHEVGKWNDGRADEAIKTLGLSGSVTYANGKLVIRGRTDDEEIVTNVKKKYSELTLRTAAKRFGWQVKNSSVNKAGLTQIHMTRR